MVLRDDDMADGLVENSRIEISNCFHNHYQRCLVMYRICIKC